MHEKRKALKSFQRYWGKPGVLSLAGGMEYFFNLSCSEHEHELAFEGLPNPTYFPFESVTGDALLPDTFHSSRHKSSGSRLYRFWNLLIKGNTRPTVPITIPKYPVEPDDVNLSAALQYAPASGIPAIRDFVHEFTNKVYHPAYEDFATLINIGNTDGWYKTFATLCNSGEGILVGEWTFPSAMAVMLPAVVTPVPVALDSQGIRSDALRTILSEWDAIARGMQRPHVLYTIPVGQNPTGTTMGPDRKKEIYDVCVQFDVIIVEDDPYYFLQEGPYVPRSQRRSTEALPDDDKYITSLVPSFLKFDYQGRVIRLDTFSKTIAPGSRLGWVTCNPLFAERLERQNEVSSQAPCGFSQSLISKLLLTWKYEGYLRWLKALGAEYTTRRDQLLDLFGEFFYLRFEPPADGGPGCYLGFFKPRYHTADEILDDKSLCYDKPLFSFVPPSSGMFLWIKVNFEDCPVEPSEGQTLESKLWARLADSNLLLAFGSIFNPGLPVSDREGYYRISFSQVDHDRMKQAISIFERVTREFFTKP